MTGPRLELRDRRRVSTVHRLESLVISHNLVSFESGFEKRKSRRISV